MNVRNAARGWGCVGAIVASAILLSGCVNGDTAPDPTLATAAATSMPSAIGVTPAPSMPPAADPDDPSTWIVSDAGMGPFTLGMPFSDAVAAVRGLQDSCGHAFSDRDSTLWIAWWQNEGSLDEVTWRPPQGAAGPHTESGLGIGSTVDEVLNEHPDAVHSFRNHDYLQAGRVVFGYAAETRIVDSIGVTTSEPQYEYCG